MTTAAIHKKAETPATTEVSASHTPVIEGNFGLAQLEAWTSHWLPTLTTVVAGWVALSAGRVALSPVTLMLLRSIRCF